MKIDIQDVWKTLKDMLQNAFKIWIFIFVVCSLIIFAPKPLLERLSLANISPAFSSYIGFIWVISLVAILILLSEMAITKISMKLNLQKYQKQLHSLTVEQKQVLCQYLLHDAVCQYFSIEDGVIGSLVSMRVLTKGTEVGRLDSWAFNIQPWAKKYLEKKIDLVTDGVPKDPYGGIKPYLRQDEF